MSVFSESCIYRKDFGSIRIALSEYPKAPTELAAPGRVVAAHSMDLVFAKHGDWSANGSLYVAASTPLTQLTPTKLVAPTRTRRPDGGGVTKEVGSA